MSEWKSKRFWKEVTTAPEDDGFAVLLDGRPVRTPAKVPLVLPTEALAREVAAEWAAQEGEIAPVSMPFTRSANAAIDKVRTQFDEVAEMLAAYGDSDLLCYRAEGPEALVVRQAEGWDPLLEWLRKAFGIALSPVSGVMHAPQPAESMVKIREITQQMSAFELTGFHDLVSLSGSFVLALAATQGLHPPETLWALSRIDETWQEEQWGRDDEATEAAEVKKAAFLHAHRFFQAARKGG
ncbi:ATP12 family chaperone protein [Marimonas lutisalis]|uniref:ATP12 family chaperone protein n=1 Tax=Marimonas lutisalis TaxID=2545756 RepID=UPI0010F4BC2F|nr:ATP12 family protein [Marimonas lutisalis]